MRLAKPIALCFGVALLGLTVGCSSPLIETLESPWRGSSHPSVAQGKEVQTPVAPTTSTISTAENPSVGPWKVGTKDRGISCWYGEKHQGLRMASGEHFDRYAFTAAHPSIPFGTIIKVRNLSNQREVVVRVEDRCAGTKGRILDLSEAAAHAIGIYSCGTTEVEVEVVPSSTPVPETLSADALPKAKISTKRVAYRSSTSSTRKKSRPLSPVKGPRRKLASETKVRLKAISSADAQ